MLMTATILSREIAPPGFKRWNPMEEMNVKDTLVERMTEWLNSLPQMEADFTKHVYDSANLRMIDIRQHRKVLHEMLGYGEDFFLDATILGLNVDLGHLLSQVEEQMVGMRKILWQWYGPIGGQTDLPDSLKEAFAEVDAGETEEFDPDTL